MSVWSETRAIKKCPTARSFSGVVFAKFLGKQGLCRRRGIDKDGREVCSDTGLNCQVE
jgi:hypothetical protein